MDTIPTPENCIKMLEEKGCSKEVIRHCKAVRDIAVIIAKKTDADVELVEAGALLHDIGRSKTHGIFHAIEGVKIARNLGLSDKLVKIIERHIGAGISAEVAKKLGLPSRDFIPQTLEEKIVCHSDNLIDNCCRQNIEYQIERALMDGHKDYALRLVNLHKELSEICGIDLNEI
jgi:uncharacterized protein (TIGR00295 family)